MYTSAWYRRLQALARSVCYSACLKGHHFHYEVTNQLADHRHCCCYLASWHRSWNRAEAWCLAAVRLEGQMAATRGVSAACLLLQSCSECEKLGCQMIAAALELTAVLIAAVADGPIGHRPLVCFSKVLLRLDNAAVAHIMNMDDIHLT